MEKKNISTKLREVATVGELGYILNNMDVITDLSIDSLSNKRSVNNVPKVTSVLSELMTEFKPEDS